MVLRRWLLAPIVLAPASARGQVGESRTLSHQGVERRCVLIMHRQRRRQSKSACARSNSGPWVRAQSYSAANGACSD